MKFPFFSILLSRKLHGDYVVIRKTEQFPGDFGEFVHFTVSENNVLAVYLQQMTSYLQYHRI